MSLYSIYFTQVLLPLLDLRYSQSHSNITIATGKCIFVLFCHFSELIRHLRAFPSFTNYEQVFCVCFQKFAATYIKKKFCHVSVSHEYFFSTVFFQFIFTGIIDLRTASFIDIVQYKHDMAEL